MTHTPKRGSREIFLSRQREAKIDSHTDTFFFLSLSVAVYELQNLSALKCFIQDNVEPGEAYLCTLNGDFLSPSLLSSLDLGAAAVSAMNTIPVTHACLGNHEFDHSIEILSQRLGELNCDVINTNVFACPEGEENTSKTATKLAIDNKEGVPHPDISGDESAGIFLDNLPRSSVVELGGVKIGLLGLCTTSTPLSSARKPKGVVFAECVPLAREAARKLVGEVDAVIALTHQTLQEDTRLAEEVPEIAAILGGHEHTPFAGRMGHGANAAAQMVGSASLEAHTTDCVNEQAGTLCVKAGMDAENVVVVTIDVPVGKNVRGKDRGGECDADAAAAALAALAAAEAKTIAVQDAARKHHDEFGKGGLWARAGSDTEGAEIEEQLLEQECAFEPSQSECSTTAANNVIPVLVDAKPGSTEATEDSSEPFPLAPGAELGAEVAVQRPGSNIVISARMFSLRGYRTDPEIDADIWHRSEVLRGLNQHTLSLHEHALKLGFSDGLSSKDSREGQCTLGTLFATILRDECLADVCLYNSGGIRGNTLYGSDPLTYGDLVAEVPFENNIITLEMTGAEMERAISFSEAEQIRKSREGGSWGGYLQWDEGVSVDKISEEEFSLRTVRGHKFDAEKTYRVVTWAGLLDGADDIPAFRDIGRKISTSLAEHACGDEECSESFLGDHDDSSPTSSAISGSDGIPFKILVVKHLARRRWSELSEHASFQDMDIDGDGLLQTVEVTKALKMFTSSKSPEQEAEAMVRSFDVDGDGAVTLLDVAELMQHFDNEKEVDLWKRVEAMKFEKSVEEISAKNSTQGTFTKKPKNSKGNKKQKRGEELLRRAEEQGG